MTWPEGGDRGKPSPERGGPERQTLLWLPRVKNGGFVSGIFSLTHLVLMRPSGVVGKKGTIISHVLEMKDSRLRATQWLAQGHTAGKWLWQNWNLGLAGPRAPSWSWEERNGQGDTGEGTETACGGGAPA